MGTNWKCLSKLFRNEYISMCRIIHFHFHYKHKNSVAQPSLNFHTPNTFTFKSYMFYKMHEKIALATFSIKLQICCLVLFSFEKHNISFRCFVWNSYARPVRIKRFKLSNRWKLPLYIINGGRGAFRLFLEFSTNP